MSFDFKVITDNLDYFIWGRTFEGELGGLFLTILMTLSSGVLSLILGIGAAFAVRLGSKPLGRILLFTAKVVRGIPLIFVIFWIYFLIPALFGAQVPGFLSVVLALAWFSSGAVMYSTLSGLDALPKGQREAGIASGMTEGQVFLNILLPQALRNLVPSYVALFSNLVKDTSLAFIMNVPELTMTANQVNSRVQVYPAEIFLFTAVVYFVLCAGISWIANGIAALLRPGRTPARSAHHFHFFRKEKCVKIKNRTMNAPIQRLG
jgi:polar amino acid transport system permease protein